MKVEIEMNGMKVPVEVSDDVILQKANEIAKEQVEKELAEMREQYSEIRTQCKKELLSQVVYKVGESESYDELLLAEVDDVIERTYYDAGEIYTWEAIADDIVSETMVKKIEDAYNKVLSDRVKYYRVDMSYTGSFTLYVKARSEDEALDYVGDMNYLEDYIDISEAEFDTDNVEEYDEEPYGVDIIDATDDF